MARKRMTGEKRKEQIISKAVDLFAKRGFAEVTTREIARAARISEATIYKYFASKEELYDAVLKFYSNKVGERIAYVGLDGHIEDINNFLTLIAHQLTGFVKEDPKIIRLMLYSGLQDHPFAEQYFKNIGLTALQRLQECIHEKQLEGSVRSDIEPLYASVCAVGMIVYYIIASLLILKGVFKDLEDEVYIRHAVDIFINGIANKTGGENR